MHVCVYEMNILASLFCLCPVVRYHSEINIKGRMSATSPNHHCSVTAALK